MFLVLRKGDFSMSMKEGAMDDKIGGMVSIQRQGHR
jgi:hypothetical protein